MFGIEKDFQDIMEVIYGPLNKDKMTEIEELKGQIKVLEKKVALLEQIEEHKSPVEKAYRDVYGKYPITDDMSGGDIDYVSWDAFQKGYNAAYEEKVAQEPEEQKWDAVRESVRWCEENPDKDPLDWVKPQTPEQTSQSLKEAFVEAQKTEKWKEIQKLIDEEDNDKNFKNSLDLIKEWGEKNKPPTLKELLWEWWEDIFTVNSNLDAENSIDYLVDIIDKKFIPPSSERNTYDWERCLKRMREKLR